MSRLNRLEVWFNLTWRYFRLGRTVRSDANREAMIRRAHRHKLRREVEVLYDKWAHGDLDRYSVDETRATLDAYTGFWFSQAGPGAESDQCG